MMPRGVATTLALGLLAAAACERPAVHDDRFRPRVAPVEAAPAPRSPAPQGRVVLLQPDLGMPEVRGPSQIDGFVQDEAAADILWVVDNSGSMDNERDRLAQAFDRFIRGLTEKQLSFRIGVVTTDMTRSGPGFSGELVGPPTVITNDTPDPVGTFTSHVRMPASRVEDEEGLAAALAALTEPLISGPNAGFLRPGADLAIIVVTDEDDGSLGEPEHYARRLMALKGLGNELTVKFSAVIGDLPDGCTSPGDEQILWGSADPGTRYAKVAELTGGLVASVCAGDWSRTLTDLALQFSGLRRIFPLSAKPVPASIRVEVDGRPIAESRDDGWIYDAQTLSIQFIGTYVPPPGATVRIRYDLEV